ncbi:MAG: hypothetical protein O2970_11430 [Proteobacteria bacterium]|nr:hypothetical protein [Pseudomonadota bacterium]
MNDLTELETTHSTFIKLIAFKDENDFVKALDLQHTNDDDHNLSSIEITKYNSALFSITEVLIMHIITEKVEWSRLPPQLNDEVNNFIIEGSFSFIKSQNIILNNDNINPAIRKIAKWLIHTGNWTIKYSGYIINPAEGGTLSIFEFIELILEESENSDEKIFQRLRNIQKSLEYLDRILGNNLFNNIIKEINRVISERDNKSLKRIINELREMLEITLTPTSWINRKSQDFANSIGNIQEPDPEPMPSN